MELRGSLACKAKYSYYHNPPINIKLFKLINEEKTHLKVINQQASSLNFRGSYELFQVQIIFFFSVSVAKMWRSLFFRGRNAALLLFCWLFGISKCNSKNLVLCQPSSHQALIDIYQLLFTANWKPKSTCSIRPMSLQPREEQKRTLLWKFELKKNKKSHISTKQGDFNSKS